jgi:hypothetical protein
MALRAASTTWIGEYHSLRAVSRWVRRQCATWQRPPQNRLGRPVSGAPKGAWIASVVHSISCATRRPWPPWVGGRIANGRTNRGRTTQDQSVDAGAATPSEQRHRHRRRPAGRDHLPAHRDVPDMHALPRPGRLDEGLGTAAGIDLAADRSRIGTRPGSTSVRRCYPTVPGRG